MAKQARRRTPPTAFPKPKGGKSNSAVPPTLQDGTRVPVSGVVRLPDGREGTLSYCRPCRPDEDSGEDAWRAVIQVPGTVGVVIEPSKLLLVRRPDTQNRDRP